MNELKEEFRPIPGYEGLYEVSNFGNVKSLINDMILKPDFTNKKYLRVTLYKDGKSRHIKNHVLVAMAFLGHVPDGTMKIVVDHIDNNKLNDNLTNLQLITHRENISKDRKNGTSKYTGVYWSKNRNKWVAKIKINGRQKYLGNFTSEEEAHEAYQKALKMYHEGDLSFMKTRIPSSKYKGVSWDKNANKWVAKIKINGKYKYLGLFTSEEEAAEECQNALKELLNTN